MTLHEPETRETEAERVVRWRLEQLVRAGFDEAAALLLAAMRNVDLHRASDLLRHGCPADTALRILL
jgi:hypothetical protein